jgi:hypothetical protein
LVLSRKPKYFKKPNLKFFATRTVSQIWTRTDRNIKQLFPVWPKNWQFQFEGVGLPLFGICLTSPRMKLIYVSWCISLSFIHSFLIFSPTAATAAFKISFAGIPFLYEIRCSYITLSSASSCVGRFLEFRFFGGTRIGQTLHFLNFFLPFCTIILRLILTRSEET